MAAKPQSDADGTIHALNIHGTFFERWCQQAIEDAEGWKVQSTNYPVQYPSGTPGARGAESKLDVRAYCEGRHLRVTLLVECKKSNPELSNWVFFPGRARERRMFSRIMPVSSEQLLVASIICGQTDASDGVWPVLEGVRPVRQFAHVASDGRETRRSYLQATKNSDRMTKTTKALIEDAARQVALARQSIVDEDLRRAQSLAPVRSDDTLLTWWTRVGWCGHIYIPLIVTTARLSVCSFDGRDVDPETGELPLDKASLLDVPELLYEYPLPVSIQRPSDSLGEADGQGNVPEEHARLDVVITQSLRFPAFLTELRRLIERERW
jgi:hypothetical protein